MRGASLWLDFDDCGVGSVFHVAYDFFAAKLWLAKRRRKLQKDTLWEKKGRLRRVVAFISGTAINFGYKILQLCAECLSLNV